MGNYIAEDESRRIEPIMVEGLGSSPAERFFKKQMERYIPRFGKSSDEEIRSFMAYQRAIRLNGETPILHEVIACLNPTFIDSAQKVEVERPGFTVYTREALKENGYRMELHRGVDRSSAITRQFTVFDLRMFPELHDTLDGLMVMIGDAELISKKYPHHRGFDRVQERIPDSTYWPDKGSLGHPDDFIQEYLSRQQLFLNGKPKEDVELTLSFHGLFAIADPDTWDLSRQEQEKSLISLCKLPVNYRKVDLLLDKLDEYLSKKGLNARVAARRTVSSSKTLVSYVQERYDQKLEGSVVVQYGEDDTGQPSFDFARSFKFKLYETIDSAILGVNLTDKAGGILASNISSAIVGLFDPSMNRYLAIHKVNLDPTGPQVKEDMKPRVEALRQDLAQLIIAKSANPANWFVSLEDVYRTQGRAKIRHMFQDDEFSDRVIALVENMPRGKKFNDVVELYERDAASYRARKGALKSSTKVDQFVFQHQGVFDRLLEKRAQDKRAFQGLNKYFSQASEVSSRSKKLKIPTVVVSTDDPIIIETKVFSMEWAKSPFPCGFHTWYVDSFLWDNVFAERLRPDKKETTSIEVVQDFCRVRHNRDPKRVRKIKHRNI